MAVWLLLTQSYWKCIVPTFLLQWAERLCASLSCLKNTIFCPGWQERLLPSNWRNDTLISHIKHIKPFIFFFRNKFPFLDVLAGGELIKVYNSQKNSAPMIKEDQCVINVDPAPTYRSSSDFISGSHETQVGYSCLCPIRIHLK